MTNIQRACLEIMKNKSDDIWNDLDDIICEKVWRIPLKTDKQRNWDILDEETGEKINLLDLRDQLQALSNICAKLLEGEE